MNKCEVVSLKKVKKIKHFLYKIRMKATMVQIWLIFEFLSIIKLNCFDLTNLFKNLSHIHIMLDESYISSGGQSCISE